MAALAVAGLGERPEQPLFHPGLDAGTGVGDDQAARLAPTVGLLHPAHRAAWRRELDGVRQQVADAPATAAACRRPLELAGPGRRELRASSRHPRTAGAWSSSSVRTSSTTSMSFQSSTILPLEMRAASISWSTSAVSCESWRSITAAAAPSSAVCPWRRRRISRLVRSGASGFLSSWLAARGTGPSPGPSSRSFVLRPA